MRTAYHQHLLVVPLLLLLLRCSVCTLTTLHYHPLPQPIADSNWRRGFNRFYDWHLARRLRQLSAEHLALFEGSDKPFDLELARRANTVRAFDDAITRVSFGRRGLYCSERVLTVC